MTQAGAEKPTTEDESRRLALRIVPFAYLLVVVAAIRSGWLGTPSLFTEIIAGSLLTAAIPISFICQSKLHPVQEEQGA